MYLCLWVFWRFVLRKVINPIIPLGNQILITSRCCGILQRSSHVSHFVCQVPSEPLELLQKLQRYKHNFRICIHNMTFYEWSHLWSLKIPSTNWETSQRYYFKAHPVTTFVNFQKKKKKGKELILANWKYPREQIAENKHAALSEHAWYCSPII